MGYAFPGSALLLSAAVLLVCFIARVAAVPLSGGVAAPLSPVPASSACMSALGVLGGEVSGSGREPGVARPADGVGLAEFISRSLEGAPTVESLCQRAVSDESPLL